MSTSSRNLPRFLPTLTEVISPAEWHNTAVTAAPDLEDMVQAVMLRMEAVIESRLREELENLIRGLVTEQRQVMSVALREELAMVVRETVAQTMKSPTEAPASEA